MTTRRGAGTRIAAVAAKGVAAGSRDPIATDVAALVAAAVAAGVPLKEMQRRMTEAWPTH
ncbi:hypothetical protein [Corynebacterium pygosceleis]|uniref:Uncharacterized protein n=1 Tax=Corynebacterium pygosceleis TaxID=2800406 RepID=A0A9Q4CAH4_9CORY|nr:hypothetical protein [Corynebacterium pygosceleis]MCK7638400.1 hypothetical protein [Corynebacterium pygosceleis]MCK7675380.1 hypothetical protein [Corynebacterium pygosceleis]MCL0121226.1 hypothetical protein [Corynebacterium pygosceleis]MCX7469063.1 hypothetical protein [Corynebacterium pygosceleis]